MTPEELKQLKPGDEIFIRARYKKIYDDGDVSFFHSNTNVYDVEIEMESYTHPRNVILPPSAPKYDPCRLFKKGDKVRVVDWNGRTNLRAGQVGFVVKNEESSGMVELSIDGWKNGVFYHACLLELVTPVEELEPFIIKEYVDFYAVEKDGAQYSIFFKGSYYAKAKEAAEAERDRLNAEHRKEQQK